MTKNKPSWHIAGVFDTKLVVQLRYKNGPSFTKCLHYTAKKDDIRWLEDNVLYYHPELSGAEVSKATFDLPMSREVTLHKEENEVKIIIRSDRFPTLFELLENYHKGLRLASREEKFKNFYQVYEGLSSEADLELRAIRHSLSHSRRKLTSKIVSAALVKMFGDTKIDLMKYRHAKVFRTKLNQLKKETEKMLVDELLRILPAEPNFLGVLYMP